MLSILLEIRPRHKVRFRKSYCQNMDEIDLIFLFVYIYLYMLMDLSVSLRDKGAKGTFSRRERHFASE